MAHYMTRSGVSAPLQRHFSTFAAAFQHLCSGVSAPLQRRLGALKHADCELKRLK